MDFTNATPFPAMAYEAMDPTGAACHVIVVRQTLAWREGRLGFLPEQDPLCVADRYVGEAGASLSWEESDLAPFKPRCDVIIQAEAHAPGGRPCRQVEIGVQILGPPVPVPLPEPPRGLNPFMDPSERAMAEWRQEVARLQGRETREVFLSARLRVIGPRQLRRRWWPSRMGRGMIRWASLGLLHPSPWRLTRPRPFLRSAVDATQAYGGANRVQSGEPAAHRLRSKDCLPGAKPVKARKGAPVETLAHAVHPGNPLGKGFATPWFLRAAKVRVLEAPGVEHPDHPFTARLFWKALRGRLGPKGHPALAPCWLGLGGRAWQPRLGLAGTYDEAWLRDRHPLPPHPRITTSGTGMRPTRPCRPRFCKGTKASCWTTSAPWTSLGRGLRETDARGFPWTCLATCSRAG